MKRFKRPINKKSSDNILIKNLNKEIRAVNQQIKSLMKKGFEEKSIAYQNLLKRLDNNKISKIDKQGKIKLLSGKEKAQQKRTMRTALNRFNESMTSTKAGIKERRRNVAQGIDKLFNGKLNESQIDKLTELFENDKFQSLKKKTDRQYNSDLLIVMQDTILNDSTADDFIEDLKMYNLINKDNETELVSLYYDLKNSI